MDFISSKFSTLNAISTSVFAVSVLAGALPVLSSKYIGEKRVEKYRILLNVFTGGMQLATILVDLIPHMVTDENHSHDSNHLYPFALVGALFLVLLGIDHLYIHKGSDHKHIETHEEHLEIQKSAFNCAESQDSASKVKTCCSKNHKSEQSASVEKQSEAVVVPAKGKSFHSGGCCGSTLSKSNSFGNALLRISAISVHSFFEGFAVNSGTNKLPLLFGLMLHKLLESFNVAVALSDLQFSYSKKVLLFLFYAILTPLSISLQGLSFISNFPIVQLWCNALCLGALLFVVFYEIITPSFRNQSNPMMKMSSITLGYALSCLAIIFAHSEGHACSGHHGHACSGHHGHDHSHHGHSH